MSDAKAISPAHVRQEPIVGEANPTAANHWFALAGRLDRASKEPPLTTREQRELSLAKWPFLLGDAILLLAAYLIYSQSPPPPGFWQVVLALLCVAAGAGLCVTPYLMEYWVGSRRAEPQGLSAAVDQLRVLESVAAQITAATERWESALQEASKRAAAAKSTAEQKGAEAQELTNATPQMNEGSPAELPIKVEQLRQSENDWLQALVQMLDHVHALQVGALQSGQPTLVEQISNFQDACREAARSVGLRPFLAEPAEEFDPQRHQLFEGQGPVPAKATVAETVTTGYTFHGRLLRPARVRLAKSPESDRAERQTERSPVPGADVPHPNGNIP